MSKAEERALEAYPIKNEWVGNQYGSYGDINEDSREKFIRGYEQAEKDFMEKFKMWVAHNGYTAQESELVYNDFKQFITEN